VIGKRLRIAEPSLKPMSRLIQGPKAEALFGRRLKYHMEAERFGKTLRDIAMRAAFGGFLHRHDIRFNGLELTHRYLEPLIKMGSAVEESGGATIVQQVIRDDP
jgi:hypothetical protein